MPRLQQSSWLCGQGNKSEWGWTSPWRLLHHGWLGRLGESLEKVSFCGEARQSSHPITSHHPLSLCLLPGGTASPALPNHMLFMLHQAPAPLPWSKDHLQSMVHLHSQCSLQAAALPGGRTLKATPKLEHFRLHNLSWLQHQRSLGCPWHKNSDGIQSRQAPVVLWILLDAPHTHTVMCCTTEARLCMSPACHISLTAQGTKSWSDKAGEFQGDLYKPKQSGEQRALGLPSCSLPESKGAPKGLKRDFRHGGMASC